MGIICFDFDGTLADTLTLETQYYLPIFHRRGIGLFKTIDDVKEACRVNYYDFCAEHDLSEELLEEILLEFQATLKTERVEEPLFPGVVEMLEALMKKHAVYIISSNDSAFIRERMAAEKLTDFAGIIGWKEAKRKKDAFLSLLQKKGGDDLCFITDSVGDVREAAEVGVPRIFGVSYGWGIGDDLLEAGAARIFDDVPSLAEALAEL